MPTVLIVGATRGLGLSLAKQYLEKGYKTYGTTRHPDGPKDAPSAINWISNIDVAAESAGTTLASTFDSSQTIDILIITAGYFGKESFDEPSFEDQVRMYTTSAIGPVFIVHFLVKAGVLARGAKVILVSSESGSITLRHQSEGGGNYGHHASKAALNMVGRLLSFDLEEEGIAVGMLHPGFMRTEMTKGVGFDKFWDEGGAVTPDEAAKSMIEFVEDFDMSKTGQYWAPRGPGDIGTAEQTLGPKDKLPTPLQLPW